MNDLFNRYEDFIWVLYVLHIIISFVLAIVLARYMRKRFHKAYKKDILRLKKVRHRSLVYRCLFKISLQRNNFFAMFLFMFIFNLSLPVLGYFGSIWVARYLNNVTYKIELKDTTMIDLEEFGLTFVKVERIFGEGSMIDLMQSEFTPKEKKIKALVAMADNKTQKNVDIIKKALANKDDEVRLYSFAIIEKFEKELNSKIHKELLAFEIEKDEFQRAIIAKELAFLYWEMIYYELSEDALKQFLVREVEKYLAIAKSYLFGDAKVRVLLGRLYMMQKDFEKAATEFHAAQAIDPENSAFMVPYLAEINFNTGNYRVVQNILKNAKGLELNATMYPIVDQWRSQEAANRDFIPTDESERDEEIIKRSIS